jgi:hypothetical protein
VSIRRSPGSSLPTFRVVVDGHQVQRWPIAARTLKVPAISEDHARKLVVGILHREAGAPPWKPLQRESMQHATARPA